MEKKASMPAQDEFVIATVKRIFPYGAFCMLDDYENLEAFIHISEVAPRWIKNIHEFLKDGQKVVAKVHRFVPEKNLIDLSLKRVTEADKKRVLEGQKRTKRGAKLFQVTLKKLGLTPQEAEPVLKDLEKSFGDVYTAFESFSFEPESAKERVSLPENWLAAILEVSQQSIKKPRVNVSGVLSVTCYAKEGVSVIKEALKSVAKLDTEDVKLSINYLGAPRYMVSVEASDYKKAESALQTATEQVTNHVKKSGGTVSMVQAEA